MGTISFDLVSYGLPIVTSIALVKATASSPGLRARSLGTCGHRNPRIAQIFGLPVTAITRQGGMRMLRFR